MEIKVGVVGTGFIGPAHVEALRRLGIEVAGIAGSSVERATPKAEALRIPRVYRSFDEMIGDPGITVVHITSPNYLHFEQVKAALLAGKHVVCEKPLAMSSTESAELVELARQRKLVNVVNFNIRFYPIAQHARAMVRQNQIGHVFIIQGSYLQDWLLLPTDWNWRIEPELSGEMRAVADIGSHWLDLVTFITGLKVEAVCADFATFIPIRRKPARPIETFSGVEAVSEDYLEHTVKTEDYATTMLRFAGGARGVLTVSQVSAGRKNWLHFEIDGSKSSLTWDSEKPNELLVGHRDRPNELLLKDPSLLAPEACQFTSYPGGHTEGYPDTFKQLYSAVYRYLRKGDFTAPPDFPTFEDGHYQLVLGEVILKSARERKWVSL